ncbi:MAG: hypothetical protein KGD73_07090 [Candidatus Lokiarchaeota archaeon]|nr:hypothetical protein [Candidatus Lokiarchaeota archaeon]
MIEELKLPSVEDNKIEEILTRAVSLFKRTGLSDLAEKWDKILRTYTNKKLAEF